MNYLITGASSGVGFETVLELSLRSSNRIIALARSDDKLQNLLNIARSITPDCKVHILKFDIVHDNYQETLIPFIKTHFNHIDVLINNAGQLINKPFLELNDEDWAEMFDSNIMGAVKMIRNLFPYFAKSQAHIVNIGSMGGFLGSSKFSGLSAYSAAKAALHNLTECLATELADKNISVNCLALGSAQTEMLEKAFPGYKSPVLAYEMGAYIANFAATGHKFYNGKVLPVALQTP